MKGPGALGPTKPPRMSGAGGPRPHLPPRVRRLWVSTGLGSIIFLYLITVTITTSFNLQL